MLFELGGYWVEVKDGDSRLYDIYSRHYSCYQYKDKRRQQWGYRNRFLIMGPGEKMPLLSVCGQAIFGWRKFKDDSGQTGVNCCFFRNEGQALSSLMILDAERRAWRKWPGERLYTYVDPNEVHSGNPGYCYEMAGWSLVRDAKGEPLLTGSGKLILEKMPPTVTIASRAAHGLPKQLTGSPADAEGMPLFEVID